MFAGRHVALAVLLFFVVSAACFAAENTTRLIVSSEGNYAVAKLYLEILDTTPVDDTRDDRLARELIGELPRTVTPSGSVYSFKMIDNEPVTFRKITRDPVTRIVSTEDVSGCIGISTGSSGIVKCDVSAVAPVAGTGMNCIQIIAVYDGSTVAGREYKPAESNSISKCSGVVATPIAGLLDEKCFPLYVLIGLLVGAMYVQGRNPLALFDITTPKLPKPKKFQFQKLRRQLGWSQAYYTFAQAGVNRAAQFAKGMNALERKMERTGINVASIRQIRNSSAPNHEKIRRLRDLFEEYERGVGANNYAVSDMGKSLNALENFDEIARVHSQTQKDVAKTAGMPNWVYQPIPKIKSSETRIGRAGVRMVNAAVITPVNYAFRTVFGMPAEGLIGAGRVLRVGTGMAASAGAGGVLAVAKKVSPGVAATALGRGLQRLSGVFARLPGQTVMNTEANLKKWNDMVIKEMKAWAVRELDGKAGVNQAMGAELLEQAKRELLRNRKPNYDSKMEIITGYLRLSGRLNSDARRVIHAYERVCNIEKEIADDLARGGSMSSTGNQERHVKLVNLVKEYKVLKRPKTVQEAIDRMVERRLLDVGYRERVMLRYNEKTKEFELEGPVFKNAYNEATTVHELREKVTDAVANEFGIKTSSGVTTTRLVKGTMMVIPLELAEHLAGFEGRERVAEVRLAEWQHVYSDAVYKRELHRQLQVRGLEGRLDSIEPAEVQSIYEAKQIAQGIAESQKGELGRLLARETDTEKQVEIASKFVIESGMVETDPYKRVDEALKKWAEDATIDRIETRMEQMGFHSIQESLDNYNMAAASAGELDRVMTEFNATKGTALVDVATKVLGEDLTVLQARITAYNNAGETEKMRMMNGTENEKGLRDTLNELTLRIMNADEDKRPEILRLAFEKGLRESAVEAKDDAGVVVRDASGAPQLEDLRLRSTRDLADALKNLGHEREVNALGLKNGDVELDKKGLMRQGGEVSFEMMQAAAWVARPEGVWMPIPLRDPQALANVKMGQADVPVNADLYVVRRSKDGAAQRLEKYNPEDKDQERYLQSIPPLPELDEFGAPTGRRVSAVEGGRMPENVEEVTRGEEAPEGTGVIAEKDEAGRRTGRAVAASGGLKWRELLAAKYLVFRQKNKDFADAELRGKPVREAVNPVWNAVAKTEHALLRPMQRGFEAGLLASSERYIRPALGFKATMEQSAEMVREFDKQFEAGKFSARMENLNANAAIKVESIASAVNACTAAIDNWLSLRQLEEAERRNGRGSSLNPEVVRRLKEARVRAEDIVKKKDATEMYKAAIDNWLSLRQLEKAERRNGRKSGLNAEAAGSVEDAHRIVNELARQVDDKTGIRKLGYRTRYVALVEMRYQSESELKQLKAEKYYFGKQVEKAKKEFGKASTALGKAKARGDRVAETKLQAEVDRLEREIDSASKQLKGYDEVKDGKTKHVDGIEDKISNLDRRLTFKREIAREMKAAKKEMDSFVCSTRAEAEEFDYVLADAQAWMHNVADLRFPLTFKLLNAATSSYGGGRYIPGPYPMGPHMYMNPFDALRGKMPFGGLWGGMLAPEHRFGQNFLRGVRAPIMAIQGVPMPYEPMHGFKNSRGMGKMLKSYVRTALPYRLGGVMPGENYTPKYTKRKELKYAHQMMKAGTPTGRSVFARGEWGSRYGGLQYASKALHDTRSIIDETLQDQSLVDSVVGLTPEQTRDMNFKTKGGYSPSNRYAMWATTRSPMEWRIGPQAAAHLVKTHPHLANEMTRESTGINVYYRRMTLGEKAAELELEYRIFRPWETPGFVAVLPPVTAYTASKWIRRHLRDFTGTLTERRRRASQRGLVYEWEKNRIETQFMLNALGVIAPGAAVAGAFAAGPMAAVTAAVAPNALAKLYDKARVARARRNLHRYAHVKYCAGCTNVFESHRPGEECPQCKSRTTRTIE